MPPIAMVDPSAAQSAASRPDLFVLSFPSISSLSSTSYHSSLVALAQTTNSIVVCIRTGTPFLDSPESFARVQFESKGKAKEEERVEDGWESLQRLLMEIYTMVMRVYLDRDEPLDSVDVVVEGMRGSSIEEQGWKSTARFAVEDHCQDTSAAVHEMNGISNGKEQQPHKIELRRSAATTALGGTFDHLHVGHKILLTLSAWMTTQRLIVGISDEVLLKRKQYQEHLESLQTRTQAVRAFLNLIKPSLQADLPPLQDIYGPTSIDPDIEAIVVSEETRSGGEAVNAERMKNGLSILRIEVVTLMPSSPSSASSSLLSRSTKMDEMSADDIAGKMGSTGIREWIERRRQQS